MDIWRSISESIPFLGWRREVYGKTNARNSNRVKRPNFSPEKNMRHVDVLEKFHTLYLVLTAPHICFFDSRARRYLEDFVSIMANEAAAFIKKVSSAGGDYCGSGILAYGKMALLLHPDTCQENGAAEAFKKVGEDGQLSSGPTLKPTPKMSQKQRKQARSEMAKQRYGQNPGPNAHNEKPVPEEVPKEWLFEVNAPDIGNVSTTNDEHFEQRECMKNRHAEGEASTDKVRVQVSNGTTAATSNGSQAQQADREFECLGDTGGFGGFGIAGFEWLMPNLSLTCLGCCISRSKMTCRKCLDLWEQRRVHLTLTLCLSFWIMLLECGPNLALPQEKKKGF